jgi:murein peptide amidase A
MREMRSSAPRRLIPLLLILALPCALPAGAAAKGVGPTPAPGGIVLPGSPYRYLTLNPGLGARMPTIVQRVERDGGRIDRWWRLRGRYFLAAAPGGRAVGLSANGRTLVMQRFSAFYPPRRTGFAVLDTAVHLRHPLRPGEDRPAHAVRRIEVPGFYGLRAVSPDGRTAYLTRYVRQKKTIVAGELRALDLVSGRLLPRSPSAPARMLAALGRRLLTAAVSWVGPREDPLLAFARTPRRPGNLLARIKVVGYSAEGRPITLRQVGDPRWSGELLVFGCIHGDECGARMIEPTTGGCPDPSADVYLVPSLNPDGAVASSRLNGHGVDLNRNFPAGWRSSGARGDPEYSGPKPFSEPESRLAARIVRALEPEATIWFHQHRGKRPFVRAWGQSAPAAHRFANLAQMPFRAMRWPAGTAPNWQNHAFEDSSSFVVELPRGELEPAMRSRLSKALVRMGRWVRED